MSQSDKKMGAFLREVSNWSWEEFFKAENDLTYTSNEAIIFSLIRSCAMQKMEAIRMSLNRLDGKLKTPIILETPKIFYLFPNASETVAVAVGIDRAEKGGDKTAVTMVDTTKEPMEIIAADIVEPEALEGEENDLPSLSLRETLTKMSDYPRELPEQLIAQARAVEGAVNGLNEMPSPIPKVKSVVAAHLLVMAASRNLAALTEVFDQIDGKLAETIQLVGEDIYITNYSNIAPEGAKPNANGVLQIEAEAAQLIWADKLKAMR